MLFVWPQTGSDWGDQITPARACIAQAARSLARDQQVILIAPDAESEQDIETQLADLPTGRLIIRRQPADDIWARDFGPLTVLTGRQRYFVDYRFDGWHHRFSAAHDDRISAALAQSDTLGPGHYRRREAVLEGGAIDCDGNGSLLATRRSLLEHPRNPGDDQRLWERRFREDLGIHRVHWLDHGALAGDDTDGHVDTLARFAPKGSIIHQGCQDPGDVHYDGLHALADQLAGLRRDDGEPYRLIPLPLPRPQTDENGRRLAAGYANFLIGNRKLLVPAYDDPADGMARRVLASCFPNHEIVGIDCRALIRQNGAIHCAAMQIPAPNA